MDLLGKVLTMLTHEFHLQSFWWNVSGWGLDTGTTLSFLKPSCQHLSWNVGIFWGSVLNSHLSLYFLYISLLIHSHIFNYHFFEDDTQIHLSSHLFIPLSFAYLLLEWCCTCNTCSAPDSTSCPQRPSIPWSPCFYNDTPPTILSPRLEVLMLSLVI